LPVHQGRCQANGKETQGQHPKFQVKHNLYHRNNKDDNRRKPKPSIQFHFSNKELLRMFHMFHGPGKKERS
jgi:hypothetical protein